jgi:hypothetical protein
MYEETLNDMLLINKMGYYGIICYAILITIILIIICYSIYLNSQEKQKVKEE